MNIAEYLDSLELKIGRHFDRVVNAVKKNTVDSYPFRLTATGATNAAGNGEFSMQGSLPSGGKSLVVGRIVIIVEGQTPGNPYVGVIGAAGSWWGLFHGKNQNLGAMDDFQPLNNAALVLPNVYTYAGHNAPIFDRGDDLVWAINNGPVSKNITVIVTGWVKNYGDDAP